MFLPDLGFHQLLRSLATGKLLNCQGDNWSMQLQLKTKELYELKKNILKMGLLECKSWMSLISDIFSAIKSREMKMNQRLFSTKSPEIITMKVVENINSGVVVHLMDGIKGKHLSCFRLFWTKVDHNLRLCSSYVDNGTVIAHYNGLFLIGRTAQRLLVCNPATREVVALPPVTYFPDTLGKESGVGIGLDHSTNKYKVVRLFLRDKGNGGVEVITVDDGGGGNYNSWRRLETYPDPYKLAGNLKVVTFRGAAYWLIYQVNINGIDGGNSEILRLDLSSEEFTLIESPLRKQQAHLIELQGQLCCFAESRDRNAGTIWVWLYNDSESDDIATHHWTLCYTIYHLSTTSVFYYAGFMPIAIDQEGCLLFEYQQRMHRCDPRTNQFYRVSTDDHHNINSLEIKTWYCHTTSYVETLVSLSTTTCH